MSYHCFLPVFSGAGLDGFRLGWFGWIQTEGWSGWAQGRRVQGAGSQGAGRRGTERRGAEAQRHRAQGAEAQSAEAQRRRDAEAQGRRVQSAEAQRRRGAGGKNFGQNVLGVATKKAPSSFLGLERA